MVATVRNQVNPNESINYSLVLTFTFHISFAPHNFLCPSGANNAYQCYSSHIY